MEDTKKIITRAVYGYKTQTFRNIVRLTGNDGEKLADILGCTVNGARVLGSSVEDDADIGKKVKVNLQFDVHIWHRSENDTKVSKVNAEFTNIIDIARQGAESYSNEEVKVRLRQTPKCVDKTVMVQAEGNIVVVQIESELEAEVIGEAALNVKVY